MCSIVIRQFLRTQLQAQLELHEAQVILDKLRKSLAFINDLPEATQLVVRESYSAAIQASFVMCMCFLAFAAVAILSWREKKLT